MYARAEDRIDAHKILNRINFNSTEEYVTDVTHFLWAMTHLSPAFIAMVFSIDIPEGI